MWRFVEATLLWLIHVCYAFFCPPVSLVALCRLVCCCLLTALAAAAAGPLASTCSMWLRATVCVELYGQVLLGQEQIWHKALLFSDIRWWTVVKLNYAACLLWNHKGVNNSIAARFYWIIHSCSCWDLYRLKLLWLWWNIGAVALFIRWFKGQTLVVLLLVGPSFAHWEGHDHVVIVHPSGSSSEEFTLFSCTPVRF